MTVSVFQLPERDVPAHTQRVQLEGQEFTLSFRYSFRGETWYLSISTVDGEDILNGRRVGCNINLLKGVSSGSRPAGAIACFALDRSDERPGLNGLGVTHELFYISSDDELLK